MRAMILAAGFGSRLGELTKDAPKCLMQAGGKALLQHSIEALQRVGVNKIMINTHYLNQQVVEFLETNGTFDLEISTSHEPELLGTGGGVLNVESFFKGTDCFLIHNSDVFSEINLKEMIAVHRKRGALATLAVMDRPTDRPLLFNGDRMLCGWENRVKKTGENFELNGQPKRFGFSGIHVVSSSIFDYCRDFAMPFSIIAPYLKAAKAGEPIVGYDIGSAYWIDAGVPERLRELQQVLEPKKTVN
jgi:MurNAc alpha-1-phosphate uridylyltransferase